MAVLVVGVPKEIKDKEGRVSVQPDGVAELAYHGREVVVQAGAGSGSGFSDDEYVAAGARVVSTADEVFAAADLIVKVKEPIAEEYDRFRPGAAAVHLSPPGGRPPAHRVPPRTAHRLDRVRDGADPGWAAAAAHADERGCGPHGCPG